MNNNPVFQQFNNMQNGNVNPAMYEAQLKSKVREMQENRVDPEKIFSQGISNGEISQQQVNFAYGIARNIAKKFFGI